MYRRNQEQIGKLDVIRHGEVIGHIDVDPQTSHFVFFPGAGNQIAYDLSDRSLSALKQKIETGVVSLH